MLTPAEQWGVPQRQEPSRPLHEWLLAPFITLYQW